MPHASVSVPARQAPASSQHPAQLEGPHRSGAASGTEASGVWSSSADRPPHAVMLAAIARLGRMDRNGVRGV